MAGTDTYVCVCGVVVGSAEELDAAGLCCDCAALEPDNGCDCPECREARERIYVGAVVTRLDTRRRAPRHRLPEAA
jgi:hypothetical protein